MRSRLTFLGLQKDFKKERKRKREEGYREKKRQKDSKTVRQKERNTVRRNERAREGWKKEESEMQRKKLKNEVDKE